MLALADPAAGVSIGVDGVCSTWGICVGCGGAEAGFAAATAVAGVLVALVLLGVQAESDNAIGSASRMIGRATRLDVELLCIPAFLNMAGIGDNSALPCRMPAHVAHPRFADPFPD